MFADLLTRIGAALAAESIPYMVIGGQAVLVHGEPRLTRDIDITVGVGPDDIDRLIAVTSTLGLTMLPDDAAAFARETMVLPAIDEASGIRVDLILSLSAYEAQAIERAEPTRLEGGSVQVATAEDLVIHKIIAGRPRDLEDVRTVLLKKPGLDRGYVRRWLEEFDAAVESDTEESRVGRFDGVLGEIE